MSPETRNSDTEPPKRLFLPSLAIAVFSAGISNAVITLLAVDIAKTYFGYSGPAGVAAVSQLTTINAAAEITFAILLSVLTVRFRYKPLLLIGMALVVASAVGSFLAPTLLSLAFFLAVEGGGSIVVSIIAFTLVGDFLPAEKRAKAIGYIVSASSVATLIVALLVGFIAGFGGWRYTFLLLALPISAAGLAMVSSVSPSKPRQQRPASNGNPFLQNFRIIFMSRSATACLIANVLTVAGTQVAVFALAFYQTQFAASRALVVGIYEMAVIIFIVAPMFSVRLVNKFGSKRIAVLSTLSSAFFTIAFFFTPSMWAAIAFDMLHVWFAATATPAFVCLVLEQVPNSRGTMMSLNTLFNNIGNVLATAMGGALLAFTSGIYGAVGFVLGSITIAGSAILLFLVKDTAKTLVEPK